MIMRRPYSRTATRRAHRLKIREAPRRQPGRLKNKLRYRIYIHESADSVAAGRFWIEVTGAKPTQFHRPTLKRHNPKTVRKNVTDGYHGCLCVRVRQSADLYRRIEGWARAAMSGTDGAP